MSRERRGNRVLVVDDTTANLQFLTNFLSGQGYVVYPASDGELALEFVKTTIPDLVLLDIRMPGLDGYEVCRRIKADERTASIPIIFISILEDERDKVKGFQAGGVDYITKPFQPEEVLARVRTHIGFRELNEELEQKVTELETANARLKELDRMKTMFIASMSHELRTPLNAAIGFSRIVQNEWLGPLNQEQKSNLESVVRACNHLLALINDVLDVSRIEAAMVRAQPTEFDVWDLISDAATSCEKAVGEKDIELEVHPIHMTLCTDRTRLLQCLLNLVSNAVKYTKAGRITISAQVVDAGNCLELSVLDTGVGIKREDIDKLFRPFVRLPYSQTAVVPGTGLGLYLSRKLVTEVLHGAMDVQSTYGSGSVFSLKVPVSLPASVATFH